MPSVGSKVCKKCLAEKDLSCFGRHCSATDNLRSKCKECVNAESKKWREENKEKYKEIKKSYEKRNRELILSKSAKVTLKIEKKLKQRLDFGITRIKTKPLIISKNGDPETKNTISRDAKFGEKNFQKKANNLILGLRKKIEKRYWLGMPKGEP